LNRKRRWGKVDSKSKRKNKRGRKEEKEGIPCDIGLTSRRSMARSAQKNRRKGPPVVSSQQGERKRQHSVRCRGLKKKKTTEGPRSLDDVR